MNIKSKNINYSDVVVIGGGASGFITAIVAKRRGIDVTILEKKTEY